jgi:type IV secretory pathway protease TraF
MKRLILVCGLACGIFGPAYAEPPAAQEAPAAATGDPVEAHYRTLAETTIADVLTDPDSAKFKWNAKSSVALTEYRVMRFAPAIKGNLVIICGRVNAKNKMGGYVGYTWFDVVLRDGVPVSHRIDDPDDNSVSETCVHVGL